MCCEVLPGCVNRCWSAMMARELCVEFMDVGIGYVGVVHILFVVLYCIDCTMLFYDMLCYGVLQCAILSMR